jgi:hypothetical protein
MDVPVIDSVKPVTIAKLTMGRYVENGSDEVKKAWRIILAELDPPPKVIRRRRG